MWDQNAFNDLFRRGAGGSEPNRVFTGYGGKLKFGILPVSLFCSGHTYFTQNMPAKKGMQPYVAMGTFDSIHGSRPPRNVLHGRLRQGTRGVRHPNRPRPPPYRAGT